MACFPLENEKMNSSGQKNAKKNRSNFLIFFDSSVNTHRGVCATKSSPETSFILGGGDFSVLVWKANQHSFSACHHHEDFLLSKTTRHSQTHLHHHIHSSLFCGQMVWALEEKEEAKSIAYSSGLFCETRHAHSKQDLWEGDWNIIFDFFNGKGPSEQWANVLSNSVPFQT